jgi:hypothetical protein
VAGSLMVEYLVPAYEGLRADKDDDGWAFLNVGIGANDIVGGDAWKS